MRFAARLLAPFLLAVTTTAQGPAPQPPPAGLIAGQIVDGSTKRPLAGAIVTLNSPQLSVFNSARPSPPHVPRVLTGSDGRFVFRDLPRGSFNISATKPGYAEGSYRRRRPGGPSQSLELGNGEQLGDVAIPMWKFGGISGTVVDEAGEPLVGISVRGFRRAVVAGIRRFVDAAAGATDDRGMYRLANLNPGEYVVAVVSRHASVPPSLTADAAGRQNVPELAALSLPSASIAVDGAVHTFVFGTATPPPPVGNRLFVYPTTYYPSATSAMLGSTVTITSAEERSGIDFQLQPVASARVSGVVSGPDGPMSVALRLEPADPTDITQRDGFVAMSAPADGQFRFAAVPAGEYVLRVSMPPRPQAKQGELDGSLWAEQPLSVGGQDINGLAVSLRRGMRVSGRFEFEGGTPPLSLAQMQQIAVTVESATGGAFAPRVPVRTDASGQFASLGLPGGRYFVRVLGSPAGWMFKSATHGGRDVADTPLDLQTDAPGIVITFTDQWSGLSGTVTPARGTTGLGGTIVLFPTNQEWWSANGLNQRRIKSTQTTAAGQYTFPVVPPGDYYVAAVPDSDAADWQDPAFLEILARAASPVRINEGEKKKLDLRMTEPR